MRVESGRKILVLCPYPVGLAPSQRLKYEQYFPAFRKAGYHIEISPFFSVDCFRILYSRGHLVAKILGTLAGYCRRLYDLWRAPDYDLVYIHLWVTPLGPPLFESLLRRIQSRLLYDLDDMIFLAPTTPQNRLVAPLKGKGKMTYLLAAAREVIVCTPALEELARRYNQNVTDISSTIDTDVYLPVNRYRNDRPLVLGWTGSHSTSRYLRLLDGVLARLAQKYEFQLLVMGDPDYRVAGVTTVSHPWSEGTEVPLLQKLDIGLYPLPLDDPWVLGKSGLKALQYMALGLPTVASAVGANFRVIEDGVSGFLVHTEEEWLAVLSRLIEDCELRRRIGESARSRVVEQFSLRANRDRYLQVVNRLVNPVHSPPGNRV